VLNVLLDFEPPLLWPDFGPLTIAAGITRTLVVGAVTEAYDVCWWLDLDWRCGRRTGSQPGSRDEDPERTVRPAGGSMRVG
jgi:hypothetical protein